MLTPEQKERTLKEIRFVLDSLTMPEMARQLIEDYAALLSLTVDGRVKELEEENAKALDALRAFRQAFEKADIKADFVGSVLLGEAILKAIPLVGQFDEYSPSPVSTVQGEREANLGDEISRFVAWVESVAKRTVHHGMGFGPDDESAAFAWVAPDERMSRAIGAHFVHEYLEYLREKQSSTVPRTEEGAVFYREVPVCSDCAFKRELAFPESTVEKWDRCDLCGCQSWIEIVSVPSTIWHNAESNHAKPYPPKPATPKGSEG